jgi:hypothetical protein
MAVCYISFFDRSLTIIGKKVSKELSDPSLAEKKKEYAEVNTSKKSHTNIFCQSFWQDEI